MANKVQICNFALSEVTGTLINTLSKPYESKEAKVCDLFYETVRQQVLRDYNWNFALSTGGLAILDTDNQLGYKYNYALPNDALKIIGIVNQAAPKYDDTAYTTLNIPYELIHDEKYNQKILVTDAENVVIRYVKDINVTELFDETFVIAFYYRLASVIAKPLVGINTGANIQASLFQLYQIALGEAQTVDAGEPTYKPDNTNVYVEARN